jgi:hypothetical protein
MPTRSTISEPPTDHSVIRTLIEASVTNGPMRTAMNARQVAGSSGDSRNDRTERLPVFEEVAPDEPSLVLLIPLDPTTVGSSFRGRYAALMTG